MSVHSNPFQKGLGYGCPGCNMDHPMGANCCSTHFGPSLPNLLPPTPQMTFTPFSKSQQMQMMRSSMKASFPPQNKNVSFPPTFSASHGIM